MRNNQSDVVGMLLQSDMEGESPVVVKFDPELWTAIRDYAWTYDGGSGEVIGHRINPETGKMNRIHLEELIDIPDGWRCDFADEDVFNYSRENLILRAH